MKNIQRTLLALALCAGAGLPGAALPAAAAAPLQEQDELPTSPELERAIVIEELEHDLRQAVELYAELADDTALADALRRHAALRLGRARAVLGEEQPAREALEFAARGDDVVAGLAREALKGPGRDEERARYLRAEARHWIDQVSRGFIGAELSSDTATNRLLWIGRAAVPELVRAIEARRDELKPSVSLVANLAALLWRIGGPEAAAYLDGLRTDENVELRRLIARGLWGDNARSDEMAAVAQRYLADPDPRGVVAILALGDPKGGAHWTWRRYDVEAILELVDSPVSDVRVAALDLLGDQFYSMRLTHGIASAMERLSPRLAGALDDLNPEIREAANGVFQRYGLLSTASRALLVERLPTAPPDFLLYGQVDDVARTDAERAVIAGLLPMLRKLGPVSKTGNQRDRSVQKFVDGYLRHLGRDSLELLLEYQRLGYDQSNRVPRWIREHGTAEDAERVLRAMVDQPALDELLWWLSSLDLDPACWPHLARVEERLLAREATDDDLLPAVRRAMGACAVPEAVAHLAETLRANPTVGSYVSLAAALLRASERRQDPDVLAALREVLVQEVEAEPKRALDVQMERQFVFAKLVELGDARAFELLPEAYRLGLRRTTIHSGYRTSPDFEGLSAQGIGWLTLRKLTAEGALHFHGYDELTLSAIWDSLLAAPRGEPWNDSWSLLVDALGAEWDGKFAWWRGRAGPTRYVETSARLVEVAARRWGERAAKEGTEQDDVLKKEELDGLRTLLDIERREIVSDPEARAALARMHAACFESPSPAVRRVAIELLATPPDAAGELAIRAALSDPDLGVAARAFDRAFELRQPVAREVFERVLSNPSDEIRTRAIHSLAPLVEGGALELVQRRLADTSADVRVAACEFLGTQVSADTVPELLVALTDIDEGVRTAAAEALRAIRFYHDEKAHWDRVFAGVELSPAGAAEALLRQAAPDSPREVRLLAIRSLGSLGVAETLPFLIEWTSGSDAELVSAARAAIERINATGD